MNFKYFKNDGTYEKFISGVTCPHITNSHEYRLYCAIIEQINNAIVNSLQSDIRCAGDIDFNRRFLGDSQNNWLITEQSGIDHFPDFAIVRKDIVIIIDHFRLSGAKRTRKGDKYLQLLGDNGIEPSIANIDDLNTLVNANNIEFTYENHISNFIFEIQQKACNAPIYKEKISEFISSGKNEDIIKEDLIKPQEVWFLVEDINPTTPLRFNCGEITEQLSRLKGQIDGIIYVWNPGFGGPLISAKHKYFIKIDDTTFNS